MAGLPTLKRSSREPLKVLSFALAIGLTDSPTHWMKANFTVGISSTTSV
jgi:hypothetical protein